MDLPCNLRRFLNFRYIVGLLIVISICVPFILYVELDNSIGKKLDIRFDQKCSVNRQSNWKWGNLKDTNAEDIRIRDSLAVELSEIAAKRDEARKIYQELISNNSKLEETMHELELSVKELMLKKKEYSDLRNVHLALPHTPVIPSNFNQIDISNPQESRFNSFESSFDYSRCSIGKKMLFYLYNLDEGDNDLVGKILFNELASNPWMTQDASMACLFIAVLSNEFDQNKYSHFYGLGRNHVFIVVNQVAAKINDVKAGMIVNSRFEMDRFRPGMDIPCYLRIPTPDVAEWTRIAPLLPHNRRILVTFESSNIGLTADEKSDFEKLQESALVSKDKIKFILDCKAIDSSDDKGLCGTKAERVDLLRQSMFVLLFPGIPSFQQRLYEALENGAIPVILSMTASLPFDEHIDWNQAVFKIPLGRFPEIHFVLRTVSIADQLEMRRKGRFYFENYLANSEKLMTAVLSTLRYRLQMPATETEDVVSVPLFNGSYVPQTTVTVSRQPFYEKLGPAETPLPSVVYLHNFTTFNLYSSKIWNQYPFYTSLSPKFFLDDAVMPSEAEFYEDTNSGMRPIAPGSGDTFAEALGGNRPREQFTVVMVTYNRDEILRWQLENLHEMPFLNKVIVIWNNIDRDPPKTWPKIHVPVHFIKATKNSLNNRFLPLDLIETEAVLSLDDDMDLKQYDMVLNFRAWRQDRKRIVGFPARYHSRYGSDIFYNSNHTCQYSMILTGAAFLHKSYFYAYHNMLPEVIRKKVDEVMNCEDIAMNFLVAHLIREPPHKITSKWTIRCPNCAENLSNDPKHFEERHECIRFFTKVFGYNPLLFSQYRVDSVLFKTRVPPNHQKCFQIV